MWDLLVRGGRIVDGHGGTPWVGDVAVSDGVIVAVGPQLDGDAAEVIDASGLVVAPGFVDIHTHYDGQATWDDVLEPSASHGVTTVVGGNCGVGFAPVRPGGEQALVELMEGVEDIPGTALHEGIEWQWETFPEFLDALGRRTWSMDVAVMVPHGPLRVYVMGDRGASNEDATAEDIAAMAQLVEEAVESGAVGFSTSRTELHRSKSGDPVPGTYANPDELLAIAHAVARAGGRMFEAAPAAIESTDASSGEIALFAEISRETGLEVSFPVLQSPVDPDGWRRQFEAIEAARRSGAKLAPQVASRPFGMLIGLPTYHAFQLRPTYRRLLAELPYEAMVGEMRRPEVRAAILAEDDLPTDPTQMFDGMAAFVRAIPDQLYVIGDPPDYEPRPESSVATLAKERDVEPVELLYDLAVQGDGRGLLLLPFFNFAEGNHDAIAEMILTSGALLGLSDGGAHCRLICDASLPTFLLTHWVRDRQRGVRLPLELVVQKQCAETAAAAGLTDRGTIEVGKRADLNVIDLEHLQLCAPRAVDDLPAGGRRLVQDASGYVATVVAGTVTRRNDTDTGARPGRLIRC
jgi:N-acyl-D-aspartate/D-glutamate deacylase